MDAKEPLMRIAIVYDCLFPGSSGGVERWLWALAAELAGLGHDVTYVTRDFGVPPQSGDVHVEYLSRADDLYTSTGTRRIGPSLGWAWRVGRYLRRERDSYDAIYVHQTPLWPVLAARAALAGYQGWWGVEWIEWWTKEYWQHYAPGATGHFGWLVQRQALRASPRILTYADITDRRIRAQHPPGVIYRLPGLIYRLGEPQPRGGYRNRLPARYVLTLGRLVPEKHPDVAVAVMAEVARRRPGVSGVVIGRGPMADSLLAMARDTGSDIRIITDADDELVVHALARAEVLLHPSTREGFGLVVMEAAEHGTPTVVVNAEDNAAVELVESGVNGRIAPRCDAAALTAAVEAVLDDSRAYRQRTFDWFATAMAERSVSASAAVLVRLIAESD